MQQEQAKEARYLYGIIKSDQERSFAGLPAIGGRNDRVYTINFRNLACVVSDSPYLRYHATRNNMMAHETVLEQIMKDFTVLPIRFGTVAEGNSRPPVEEIRHKLLESRYQEFLSLHEEMSRCVELGLKVLWHNEKIIYQEIVNENKELRKLRDAVAGCSPEAKHFERARLGEMVKKALNHKREKEAQILLARLRPVADRIRENKIVIDRMVLNAALLVRREREEECDNIVRELAEEIGERAIFKYTGPNPPFNFCQIMVEW